MSGNMHHSIWLQNHSLDDGICAGAYEAAGALARSTLKLCIARLHAFWGEAPLASVTSLSYAQGFSLVRDRTPVPYALILCPVSHAHPAQLLAACLPAILANVPLIIPCLVVEGAQRVLAKGAQSFLPESANALLAALELAGLEQTAVAGEAEVLECIALLHQDLGPGRIAVLGEPGFGDAFALAAYRLGASLFNGTAAQPAEGTSTFSVDAAHEGIWIWPDLGPDWFCLSRLEISKRE